VGTAPHDPAAYTQGLIWYEGKLYESTGQYGHSTLRRIEPATGEVEAMAKLSPHLFGEGLARVGRRLVQLTWREGLVLVWDLASFEELDRWRFSGEGWGLCHDERHLVMSDGSSFLTFREPSSFEVVRRVQVKIGERPLARINELECAEGWIFANVYTTDSIVRIDPETGAVAAIVDASGLLDADEARGVDVLNGIAYQPARQTFYLTGKLWPRLFEVRFVPVAGDGSS
jgi:glutamine cyclotransferase